MGREERGGRGRKGGKSGRDGKGDYSKYGNDLEGNKRGNKSLKSGCKENNCYLSNLMQPLIKTEWKLLKKKNISK